MSKLPAENEFWEGYAGRYGAMRLLQPYVDLTDEVIDSAGIVSGKRVLDVGCGPGEVIWRLRSRQIICHVTGLDNAETMLQCARQEALRYRGDVRLLKADLAAPLFQWPVNDQFDCIIAKHSLYPFANLGDMLRKLARLAAPGATLVIALPRPGARTEPVLRQHQAQTGATAAQMRTLRNNPYLREILEETPAVLERYRYNLLTEGQLRQQFQNTGWAISEIRPAYAGQDWLVVARRVGHGRTKVWLAESASDRRLALAVRYEALADLEDYTGKQPGEPLDEYDGPTTDLFIATYNDLPVGVGRVQYASNFQSEHILRQLGWRPVADMSRYAEPTRTGLLPEYRGTEIGRDLARRVVGFEIIQSQRRGCRYWLVTMREGMRRLLAYFPWQLCNETVEYPPEQGGPNVNEFIWAATLDFQEAIAATRRLRPDLATVMFPQAGPTPARINTDRLVELVRANSELAEQYMSDWRAGRLRPRQIN